MELEVITPAEFRKLQLQVDILQRFLTKTFGSSFLDFCKLAQAQSVGKGVNGKTLPPLNKAHVSTSNGNGIGSAEIKVEVNGTNNKASPATRRPPPPPLLHRPSGTLGMVAGNKGAVAAMTIKREGNTNVNNGAGRSVTTTRIGNGNAAAVVDTGENEQDFYDEGNDDDLAQFIQPEAVFSDDEHGNGNGSMKKQTKNGLKRGHAVAFGYNQSEDLMENGNNMHLPEGTECIVLESDDDPGQHENYLYQQDDELYGVDDGMNNGEEMYDEEGYGYTMGEEGVDMNGDDTGNYQTEELQTDGNVTFGTVITAQDTGIQYFQCAFCPSAKVFKHKQSLKEHYLLNHSPTPPAFQCQCGRRFLKQSQLKRHEVVHTAERPYVCPVCGKDFTRKDNMTVHMVRNHSEKKHPCPVCPDKVYATPAEVNRHLRMYHSQWQQ